ncbi:squalene synthase-like isoform X2 [Nicotiana tabacum]|uniref:Squalene synthase n=1 Tax=Nicotiana tabacum TaxID=4097 RepID=A0A1S3WZ27_TOBAC|nr:PREDICTED: squalene synthase-like isoform X2 [Nicotiana tabacum]
MGSLGAMLRNPEDIYPLMKLKLAARYAEKQIPPQPHWAFCYIMLRKVSRSFSLVIQQLPVELRDAVCIFYLVLRALDTVEDDTSVATEVKAPILMSFHRHVYDREWHFSCGTKDYKVLMDQFHHVSTAFLELGKHYKEAIEDITMRMGAGMAKFICKEVETIDDYAEYCHYVAGLVGLGLSKLFRASGKEDLVSDSLSNSMGLFLQKTNIIRDYLEDINEVPKCRMFWPRQIWSKYVNKLEVMAIGTLAKCYNNIEVFRGVVKMRRGLTAKVIDRTRNMADVYGAFYDFSCILKSKVEYKDPNAAKTLRRLETILRTCKDSGTLNKRKSFVIQSRPNYNSALVVVLVVIIAILSAYQSGNRP